MKNFTGIKKCIHFIVGVTMLVPVMLKADETIPLQFKEGDVISANVINTLLTRLNDVQKGFTSSSELDGNWDCTTSTRIQNSDSRCVANGLLYTKTGILSFDSAAGTWSYAGNGGTDGVESCGAFASSGAYDVQANHLILEGSPFGTSMVNVYPLTRSSPNVFRWDGSNSSIIECTKIGVPPEPAGSLAAVVSTTSVILTWTDQSTDETGFRVERKSSVDGAWNIVTTTIQNVTSYNDADLTSGAYWYRVIATNSYGDAISSSEVQVVVP